MIHRSPADYDDNRASPGCAAPVAPVPRIPGCQPLTSENGPVESENGSPVPAQSDFSSQPRQPRPLLPPTLPLQPSQPGHIGHAEQLIVPVMRVVGCNDNKGCAGGPFVLVVRDWREYPAQPAGPASLHNPHNHDSVACGQVVTVVTIVTDSTCGVRLFGLCGMQRLGQRPKTKFRFRLDSA